MSLTPGTRLGVYEVIAAIGQGGMGEVYRARDTKLDRDVAIKILPEAFAHDVERVARFQREAKTLAALNHANIGGIHGFEEYTTVVSGFSQTSAALVLELVEGPTLADRIAEGPIPVGEALPIARQIAEAVGAAHEHGIVHRDLKPANIKLRDDGAVKVLDFGLAKLNDPSANGPNVPNDPNALTASPTLSVMATQAGVILGTAAYMSPEQAKGKPADRRADIWAFGCVLYETLTGRRAFEGDDVTETLAAVVLREPDWSRLPSDVPPVIRTLLRRSLEKDRRKRMADISTALVLIEEAPGLVSPPGSAEADRYVHPSRVALVAAATSVVVASIAVPVTWWMARPAPPRVVRTEVTTTEEPLSFGPLDRNIAITPDGSRLIYRGNNRLVIRSLDQAQPTVVNGVGAARDVFVSPDGQWVGYWDLGLKRVAITGGPPITVAPNARGTRGATWAADTIVFADATPDVGLHAVPAGGGEPRVLTKPDRARGESDHLWPEFLPGGQAVLFTITPQAIGSGNTQIAVLDLQSGTYKVVLRGGSHARFVPPGYLVYAATGTLRAVAFDPDRLEVVGSPVPVVEGVQMTLQGGVNVAVAADGTMVYLPGRGDLVAPRSLAWVDRTGREEPLPLPPRPYLYPRISPDGTRVGLSIFDQENDVWVWDLARATLTRLTFGAALDRYSVWTPDSRRIVFSSTSAGGPYNLYWLPADGTGPAERLIESAQSQYPMSFTPDGTRLVLYEVEGVGTANDVALLRLDGERRATPLIQGRSNEMNAELSPDGRWLAYQSDESGQFEVFVRPFPDVNAGRWQVSSGGGTRPLWARTGRELFYLTQEAAMMRVTVESGTPPVFGAPAMLFQGRNFVGSDVLGGSPGRTYDISPDGRRFLMLKDAGAPDDASTIPRLVVVQNWDQELKRLVPTN